MFYNISFLIEVKETCYIYAIEHVFVLYLAKRPYLCSVKRKTKDNKRGQARPM